VKTYIDDLHLISSSTHQDELVPTVKKELVELAPICEDNTMSTLVCRESKKKFSAQEMEHFFENMFLFPQIKVPQDNYSTESLFQQILRNFLERCSVGDVCANFDFPMVSSDFETSLISQEIALKPMVETEEAMEFSDILE
jgi:hypothetical protein